MYNSFFAKCANCLVVSVALAAAWVPALTMAETERSIVWIGGNPYTVTILRSDALEVSYLSKEILANAGELYVSEMLERGTLLNRKKARAISPSERAEQNRKIERKLRSAISTMVGPDSSLITVARGIHSRSVDAIVRLVRRNHPLINRLKDIHPLVDQIRELESQGPLTELKHFVIRGSLESQAYREQQYLIARFISEELKRGVSSGGTVGARGEARVILETDPGAHSKRYDRAYGISNKFPVVPDPDFDKDVVVQWGTENSMQGRLVQLVENFEENVGFKPKIIPLSRSELVELQRGMAHFSNKTWNFGRSVPLRAARYAQEEPLEEMIFPRSCSESFGRAKLRKQAR